MYRPKRHPASIPNIVVFGQTGVGKSSLINMMARREVTKVSNQAAGCTTSTQNYKISFDESHTYMFYDTPGLNEGEHGNVPAQQAFAHLRNLIEKGAINLIIYCIRGSRLTEIVRVNYDIFYRIICEGKVPIVLVVTGLESANDMDQWWKNSEAVIKRMDITFAGHACVTTTKGRDEVYTEKFQESERRVRELVKQHCTPDPWTPTSQWLAEVPSRMDRYMKEYNARTGRERNVLPNLSQQHPVKRSSKSGSHPSESSSFSNAQSITHNIILFGESGSGKSSIVNMIVGQNVAKVSSDPTGCTFESESYETRIGNTSYRIYDTVGLNEGDEGRVPHWKAIQGLYTLIRQLEGVSLLIFCVQGRMTITARSNWLFFFDAICGRNVPIIAVVTRSEGEANLEKAAEEHKAVFKRYSMLPKEVACVVSIWGKNNEYEEIYKWSQQKLRSLIANSRKEEPWSREKEEWFNQLYERSYELQLCIFAKSRLQFVGEIRRTFEDFKRNTVLKESDIDKLRQGLVQAEKKFLKKKTGH